MVWGSSPRPRTCEAGALPPSHIPKPHWTSDIFYINLSNWKLEYSNIQSIANSRLNLHHSFTIGMAMLSFFPFFHFLFYRKPCFAFPQGKNEGNRETDLKYVTFRQLSVSKLEKKFFFCYKARVCWIPRCTLWLHFLQEILTYYFIFERGWTKFF